MPGPELCTIQVPAAGKGCKGPQIRLSLPSFSGGTAHCPPLMQYTCQLATRVGLLPSLHAQARLPSAGLVHPESSPDTGLHKYKLTKVACLDPSCGAHLPASNADVPRLRLIYHQAVLCP